MEHYNLIVVLLKKLCWVHFVATDYLRVALPMGFKARVVLSLTCLRAVILRVTSGATPFQGVLCT